MTDEDGQSRKFKIIKSSALDINLSVRVTKSSARNNMLNARDTKLSVGDKIMCPKPAFIRVIHWSNIIVSNNRHSSICCIKLKQNENSIGCVMVSVLA